MRRRSRPPPPAFHDYTPDIDGLQLRLTAFMLRWQGVTPMPQAVAEAVEELTTTLEELQAMNQDLALSQAAALASQQRYQELFEGVPEAYLVTDVQGLIQEANRPAAHLFNVDRAHLTGLPLAVFIAQDMRASFRAQFAWLRTGAEVREWVVGVQPRHRPTVTVVCHVAPALDGAGALIGLRWLLRDLKPPPPQEATVEPQGRDLTAALAQANRALQATQERTELHRRELHHRVRNHLQIAASLLNGRAHGLQDPQAQAALQACQAHLRTIALLHELLSHAGEGEPLVLGDYLRRLALLVFEAYGIDRARVHLTLEADAVRVAAPTALACGLLVHEVLSNSLQHAFPGDQAGTVAVTLQGAPPGQVALTIRDTGVGVPTDLQVREAEGLGLRLIRALTEQLQGTLVVTRDQGTCVALRFPL